VLLSLRRDSFITVLCRGLLAGLPYDVQYNFGALSIISSNHVVHRSTRKRLLTSNPSFSLTFISKMLVFSNLPSPSAQQPN
jgi:hypothetical protein